MQRQTKALAMITNTFCHIPGIGTKTERTLWNNGLLSWNHLTEETTARIPPARRSMLERYCRESTANLAARNTAYFAERLSPKETWRLYPDFENWIAYLDIETTGLGADLDCITTIAVYDGSETYTFVQGQNMDEFADCINRYKVIVTFNGKTFDLPFIRRHMGIPMNHAHIDLRYVLCSLGFKGGLKKCEKLLGIDRKELTDVDGYFAVLLWQEYLKTGRKETLETLLAYNVADVVNLAAILPITYNMKIKDTPFEKTHERPLVDLPPIPYKADLETINRIRRSIL